MIEGPEVRRILIMGQVFALLGGLVGHCATTSTIRIVVILDGCVAIRSRAPTIHQSVFSTRLQMQWIEAVDSTATKLSGLHSNGSQSGFHPRHPDVRPPCHRRARARRMRTDPDQDAVAASGFHQ